MLLLAPVGTEKVGRDPEQPGPHLPQGRIEALSPPEGDGKGLGGEVIRQCAPDSPSEETVDILEVRRKGGLKRLTIDERAPHRGGDVRPAFSFHDVFLSEFPLTVA